jgi:hypothetical protein
LYNERGHQRLRLLDVNVADGSVQTVIDEFSPTFIHYSSDGKFELRWLDDQTVLWASERSGWNHLYRYSLQSRALLNAVTQGEWNVRRIEQIDQVNGWIWFYAVAQWPNRTLITSISVEFVWMDQHFRCSRTATGRIQLSGRRTAAGFLIAGRELISRR